ncbi:FadR family transcriptional regulator [Pseudonocardia sp. DSM 110487]|uniref:FadR/GntR family transcriptional regulator n=1 Tax=Pseudonocardia sp. DSM 110487 TaxID=2865833 RepID=UPI001C699BF7|nr:FadR/GntR family transcriptional regulator [Pseudonocardia sp. DSM 110487]QYN33197.1 FadR family transcriptional regulator [Pseudonocardia sp. DSM 110487]
MNLVAELVPFLLSRGYAPNERAPSERELAERFGASRTQVREALSVLETLRLIERRPKSGVYMTVESASIEALRLFAEIGVPLPGDEGGQAAEVRRIQELEAARLACRRHRDEDISHLRRCLDDWVGAIGEAARIAELDRVFHCGIVRATQNTVLLRLVNVFYLMTQQGRAVYFGNPARQQQSLREHREILDAIVARDEERAVRLLDAHMSGADSYWQDLVARV